VIDVDELVRRELNQLPLPSEAGRPDWDGVLARVRPQSRPRRRRVVSAALVIALGAVVVVATPLGAAIGRTFDGFSAWLTGEPGTPVSEQEQRAFEQANARSWAAFPAGTQLRRLLVTRAAGMTFTLYGFRGGESLCLRLVAEGAADGTSTSCAPLRALRTAKAPALVVATDYSYGTSERVDRDSFLARYGYVPVRAAATFGIAADGVTGVTLEADDGEHRALIDSNAFLYVADHPALGVRVRGATATSADGRVTRLAVAPAPFGALGTTGAAPQGTPHGPKGVERAVNDGTVGWIERREPRGEPVPAELGRLPIVTPSFARLVRPDPGYAAGVAVLVGDRTYPLNGGEQRETLCRFLVLERAAGGGCSPLAEFFARGPTSTGVSTGGGGDQYSWLAGLATDDVVAIRLFLGNGETQDVAVTDNAYVAPVERAFFPVRVVAYDSSGLIVGNELLPGDGVRTRVPRAARNSVRTRTRLVGPHGTEAVFRVGDPAGGRLCSSLVVSTGAKWGGCSPWPRRGGPAMAVGRMWKGNDVFLVGHVPTEVTRLVIRFADGSTAITRPVHGVVAYVVPAGHPPPKGEVVALTGYDRHGRIVGRQGIRIRR
jgi:hypothetical protein